MGSIIETQVRIASSRGSCAGALLRPDGPGSFLPRRPIILLGHGPGARTRLDVCARRFAQAGYLALAFEHRGSEEALRDEQQPFSLRQQHEDWRGALHYARSVPGADPGKVAVLGALFGGGHAIQLAAEDSSLAAVIAERPLTSGPAALAALIRAREAPFETGISVRAATQIARWKPGRSAAKATAPILFAICDRDSIVPPRPTLRFARSAPSATVKHYPCDQFEIGTSTIFQEAVEDYVAFLHQHLPVPEL